MLVVRASGRDCYNNKVIRAIIFDCFGVLVGRGFAETYRLAGGDPIRDARFIEDTLGQANLGLMSEPEFYRTMAAQLGISEAEFHQAIVRAEQPNDELLNYIAELHKMYKTAVLSNANLGVLERKIDPELLRNIFDALIISAEVGTVKPHPEIYILAAQKLRVEPSECLFIDDHRSYCQAAEKTGMRSILYTSFGQFKSKLEQVLAK